MQIFISYGRKDAAKFALRLAEWLRTQGFDPWLDVKQGAPIGTAFDRRIELGIEHSNLMVALLSPWSLRPESFCRNELLYAQAMKRPIIPIRLAELIPPIQILPLSWLDAFPDPDIAFEKLPSIITDVARTGKMPHRILAGIESARSTWVSEEKLDFQEEMSRYGGSFTGRDWLFAELREWAMSPDSRLLLLTADAGVGKSAITTQMTARLNVKGVHFCSRSNIESCRPSAWLSNLVYQLAAQFVAYREQITKLDAPNWSEPPESLFRNLISDPLRRCSNQLQVDEPWIFVVDGLDESEAASKPSLSDLLVGSAELIPDWLRLVATSRPDHELLSRSRIGGVQRWRMDAQGESNCQDLQDYVTQRLQKMDGGKTIPDYIDTASRITTLASGNFLFAKMTLDALSSSDPECQMNLDEIGALPPNLGGLYHAMFRKRFASGHRYRRDILPVLDCLVSSQEPLPRTLLLQAAGTGEHKADIGLQALSQFLNDTERGLQLFHRSLGDWLINHQSSAQFAASSLDGHRRLAEACWQEHQTQTEKSSHYTIAHMPTHLAEAGRWDDLLQLIRARGLNLLNRWVEGGEGDQGIACLSGVIQHLERTHREPLNSAGLATQLARIYSLRGQYTEAEEWLNRVLLRTSIARGRRIRAIALHELASLQLYGGRSRETAARRDYARALRLCRWGIPRYRDEASANLVGLATLAYKMCAFPRTLRLARRAVREARHASDLRHVIAATRLLAMTYKILGRYKEAETQLLNALALSEACGSRLERARLLLLYGHLLYDLALLEGGLPQKSMKLFSEALRESEHLHNLYCELEARLSLSMCNLASGATQEAEKCLEGLEHTIPQGSHFELQATLGLARAAVAQQQGAFDAALELYAKCANRCREWDERSSRCKSHIGLGAIHWHGGRSEKAELEWNEAIKVAGMVSQARQKLAEHSISLCRANSRNVPR